MEVNSASYLPPQEVLLSGFDKTNTKLVVINELAISSSSNLASHESFDTLSYILLRPSVSSTKRRTMQRSVENPRFADGVYLDAPVNNAMSIP